MRSHCSLFVALLVFGRRAESRVFAAFEIVCVTGFDLFTQRVAYALGGYHFFDPRGG